MNATHLKIGRILGRKLYRKSCSVGNGIIYMVRRDSHTTRLIHCLLPTCCEHHSSDHLLLVIPAPACKRKRITKNDNYARFQREFAHGTLLWRFQVKLHALHELLSLTRLYIFYAYRAQHLPAGTVRGPCRRLGAMVGSRSALFSAGSMGWRGVQFTDYKEK